VKKSVAADVIMKGTTALAQCYDIGWVHIDEDTVQQLMAQL
jgi:hypothetical protein